MITDVMQEHKDQTHVKEEILGGKKWQEKYKLDLLNLYSENEKKYSNKKVSESQSQRGKYGWTKGSE